MHCMESLLYFYNKRGTYGIKSIHAFFINLRNPIPLQIHASPPFATPDAKSCFCFPSLWQSKRKKPNFFAKNDSGKTLAEVTEKTLQDQRGRKEDLERITNGYGTQLRINRRIQAGLLSKTEGLDKCAQKVRRSYGR